MTTTEALTDTQKIAAHLRAVIAVLDALPTEVETPDSFDTYEFLDQPKISWLIFGDDEPAQKDRAAAIMRAIGGKWDKEPGGEHFRFTSERGGVALNITVSREAVCERVVTGTHEETVQVPDPTVEVPTVTEVRIVEDFEWVCAPVLGGAA